VRRKMKSEMNNIPDGWQEYKIEEIGDVVGGGTPSSAVPEYWGGEVSWISPKDLTGYTNVYISNGGRNITDLGLKKSSSKLLPKNTLLISSRAPIGYMAIASNDICTNQGFKSIVPKEELVETKFLYYLMKTKVDFLKSIGTGTTFAEISGKVLKGVEVLLPPLSEQKAIAHILGTLDDKIELNRRMNETLEGMAQALFKSWFVDFDPVIDNILLSSLKEYPSPSLSQRERDTDSSTVGRSGGEGSKNRFFAGIPEEFLERAKTRYKALIDGTANREVAKDFPNSFQETEEMGWIPEGWEVSTIGEEVDSVGGTTPSSKNYKFWDDGDIYWTTPKDLSNQSSKVLLDTARKITKDGLQKISSGLLPVDTVLMSSRAPVGYLALAKVPLAINQGYIAMKCSKKLTPEYVIQWTDSVMDDIKQRAGGTTFAEISKKSFRVIPVIVPDEETIKVYSKTVKEFYDKITENILETNQLESLRDTLLPKLISGELRIEDAEKEWGQNV